MSWCPFTRIGAFEMKRRNGRAKRLPDDACPTCGAGMLKRRGPVKAPINGEQVSVPSVPHLGCPKCGEKMLDAVAAQRLHEDAIGIYRERHGLLAASEIRGIRDRHRLTQADLARLLRLGANTISRWESGRNVQSAAMDLLLRLVRDLPGSVAWLRQHSE